MSSQGFDKKSGPGTGSLKQQTSFGFGYIPHFQSPPTRFTGSQKFDDYQSPIPSHNTGNVFSSKTHDYQSLAVSPNFPLRNPGNVFPAKTQVQDLKRTRSPPLLSTDKELLQNSRIVGGSHSASQITKSPPRNHSGQYFGTSSEIKRPSVSPPRIGTRPNSRADPRGHVPYADLYDTEVPATNSSDIPGSKRSRVPFPTLTDPGFQGNNSSILDDTERELHAKAKRLARFRDELSQPESSDLGNRNQKAQQLDQSGVESRKFIAEASDLRNINLSSEVEDQDSSTVIIGYCPDMCPEQERAERERKGDLDQYERLDGDRNQTTESLAVKKYTRTAEREAALIRPMAILQKTMDYLLNLLDRPYDDKLLGLYNFLWDRMRAIRMDLRMQHLFNLGAITMLEQMIRLHIIAMHELCQYTKGEGFSEGFDAHLNIEQMNKTSVELFQLYDDHRKKGIEVPTEREFRGYYALLKLDKHPGYKVEPAELSLDLAKMTPGIRQAAEVLFARNVARACRTGNFIAFFRLARKASYLQACLMHAHFGKLRTQALASLHTGLQNNQGIPVTQVAKWLGMEKDNMEDLLEYHGFSIKEFEEPYMVKERLFLNGDGEYPLKRSKLVHLKKSTTVVEDVSSSSVTEPLPSEDLNGFQMDMASAHKASPKETSSFSKAVDSEMADYVAVSSTKDDIQVQPMFSTVVTDKWNQPRPHMEVVRPSPRDIFKTSTSFGPPKVITNSPEKPSYDKLFRKSLEKHGQSNVYAIPTQVTPTKSFVEPLPELQKDSPVENLVVNPVFVEDLEAEEPVAMIQEVASEVDTTSIDEEIAEAKLKLILRLWRRRTLIKKDLRDKKQLAATAALSFLSLGPPMRHYKEQLRIPVDFNIDRAMCERYEKQAQLWSTVNVSDVVAAKLGERNQYRRCICWKLLLCCLDSDGNNLDPGSWLRSKLMPTNIGDNDDLVASLPGLSIWKKWDYGKSISDRTCYLSVVKDVQFDNLLEETIMGASAVMFLASEHILWEAQKIRLHSLVSSIPYGSCLPLVILSGSYFSNPSIIVDNLGLNEVDKSRIGCFSVVSLVTNKQRKHTDGFFCDENLRTGLEWLANESPVQPVVHRVKTRELVLTHLRCLLTQFDAFKASPERCVSAMNEALDESIKEIGYSAKSNPVCWPCPEISLLNEPERRISELHLPSIGWSSKARIEPLIQALRNTKLPTIMKDVSLTGINIENQRLELERFLVNYLTPLMGLPLAQKETSILIQNCVGLELHGSSYYIVPKWVVIFRRVFNWQLTSLTNGAFTTAYILDEHNARSEDESCYNLVSPSLDEMIEACCFRPTSDSTLTPVAYDEIEPPRVESEDDSIAVAMQESKENENERSLSKLLEQCNIVQNLIDKKLSIYF